MSLTANKTGTLQGSASLFQGWLNLPGTAGSYMNLGSSVPTNFDFRTQNLFVEAWVFINSYASGAAQVIINRVNPVGTTYLNLDWVLYIDLDSKCKFHTSSGSSVVVATHPTIISASTWTHVAASYNSSTNSVILFVGGGPNTSTTLVASPQFDSTKATLIGMGAGGNYRLNGYIQDVRVVKGGTVPTTSFTPPANSYFNMLAPSYVPGGTCVLSLATQYFLNSLTTVTPSGRAGGYGANGTGGDTTQIIGGNKVHTFTTVGTQTFTVTGYGTMTVLVVAGGGGGGYDRAAGGGGGGVVYTTVAVQPGTYSVTVGDGGAGRSGSNGNGSNGQNSVFGPLTAIGGGGGGGYAVGSNGGSGGGGHGQASYLGGNGTAGQGYFGGAGTTGTNANSGGGGGAGGPGVVAGSGLNAAGGTGGPGILLSISGTPTYYAGGGGGSVAFDTYAGTSGNGLGGVGGGGNSGQVRGANGSNGTANTGGGGGGGANNPPGNGGNGGSGIVIVSYPTVLPTIFSNIFLQTNYFYSLLPQTSSVASALSLRSLTGRWVKAVNVRRYVDNATLDFFADPFGNLSPSLANWLGSSTGYVTTLYDQSGSGNHATQTTAANQPVIRRATKGPGYMCLFSGSQYFSGISYTIINGSKYTVNILERRTAVSGTGNNGNNTTDNPVWSCGYATGSAACYPHYTYRTTSTMFYGQYANDLGTVNITSFTNSSSEPFRSHFSMVSSTSGAKQYIYNDTTPSTVILAQNTALTTLPAMSAGTLVIGFNNFYPAQGTAGVANGMYYIGEMYEAIIFKNSLYDVDGTTTMTNIYNNQRGYYT